VKGKGKPPVADKTTTIALVSCSGPKAKTARAARYLYTSPLFRLSLDYAERNAATSYVLSARHHLVGLDDVIEPYDERLPTQKDEHHRWGGMVVAMLATRRSHGSHLLILAGESYARAVIGAGQGVLWKAGDWRAHTSQPLARMQIGQRLKWLRDHGAVL